MTCKRNGISPRAIFIIGFSALAIFLVLRYSGSAAEGVKGAMALCANTVIPSLFPFMVVSEIVITLGASEYLGRLFLTVLRPIFKTNENGVSVFLLGTLCGFPIGAKTAVTLCGQGKLSEREVSRLLCFCNNPSPAFIINAVGLSIFGSSALGIALYAVTLLSAVIIGLFLGFLSKEKGGEKDKKLSANSTVRAQRIGIRAITGAVNDSVGAMLTVCGFIIFFSALVATLKAAFLPIGAPDELVAAVVGFFEMTNGVACASGIKEGELAFLLCAAAVGWSGVSVHFQIMTICKDLNLDFRPYFAAKSAQSALNIIFALAYLRIFKPRISTRLDVGIPTFLPISETLSRAIFAAFGILVVAFFVRKIKKTGKSRKIDRTCKKTH